MDFTRETFAAALAKAIPAVVDSAFGVVGVDPKSLKLAALDIQAKRKATTQQVDAFVGAQKYRIVKEYDDNIDVSNQGQPSGIPSFDGGEGFTGFDGTSDLQGTTRLMVSKFGGTAEVHAFVGGDDGWKIIATGEKVTGLARVDGIGTMIAANQAPPNS